MHPETLVVAAFVAQSRHQFRYAASLLDRALHSNSRNDEAWLLKASVHLVTGDVRRATDACKQLRAVPALVLLTCYGRIAVMSGDAVTALDRLRRVLLVAEQQELSPEILAWSLSVVGDLAAITGDGNAARQFYEYSLALTEQTQVRAALVDVLLVQSEYEAAMAAIPSTSTALPLVVRRLIAAKHLSSLNELADVSAQVANEFKKWIAAEDWLHAREMSRFYLDVFDDPGLARQLADVNIKLQQEPEDVRLLERTRPPSRSL